MREVRKKTHKSKQRNKQGCCLSKLLVFAFVFGILGFLGFRLANEMGLKTYLLQLKYPIRYQDIVENYAEEFDLDQALVYSVILTESRFDTYAESKVGAKGVMQLTDETGSECAKKLGIENFMPEQLFEPEINIRLGCYYLKKLIRDYDGITETAIAAYNGGPGNVNQWLRNPEYSSGDGILNEIPFRETRDYVQKVRKAYWNYQSIYHLDEGDVYNGSTEGFVL